MKKLYYSLMVGMFLSLIVPCNLYAMEKKGVYLVTKDGTGDFNTIQDAVNFAEDKSVIIIYPGIYEEYIEIYDKELSLVGTDREKCIIMAESSHYYEAPVEIGAGLIQNLTIYGYLAGYTKGALKNLMEPDFYSEEPVGHDKYLGYAIHIDQDYSYNRKLTIDNCSIYSDTNQCVGIGARGNCTIEITGCRIMARGKGGCIFLHNYPGSNFKGESNFILRDDILENYRNPYVMSFESYGTNNIINLAFQNVRVFTVAYDTTDCYLPYNVNTFSTIEELYLNQLNGTNCNEIVHYISTKNGLNYLTSLDKTDLFLNQKIQLMEGINVLELYEIFKYIDKPVNFEENPSCRKTAINIDNKTGSIGNGWCGLDGFTLRQDSIFNTLDEMNFATYQMELQK